MAKRMYIFVLKANSVFFYLRVCVIVILLCAAFLQGNTQQLSFRHLGVAEGMPSDIAGHACFDSTGFVWISTNDGLISYDGTRIYQYLKETHAGLPRNEIGSLFCDSRNRIWICTDEGLAIMDEKRRIRRITLHDSLQKVNIDFCFEVAGLGMIAIGSKKTYLLREGKQTWEPLQWFDDKIRKGAYISSLRLFNKQAFMFVMNGKAMLVNFAQQKMLANVSVEDISSISKLNDEELLAASGKRFKLYRINIKNNSIVKTYADVLDAGGNKITAGVYSASKAANGLVYLSTRSGGLIGFDAERNIFYSYRHVPLDLASISSDNLRWVFCNPNGYMMITSTKGVNLVNVLTQMFQQQHNFVNETGKIIDGGIISIAEAADQHVWIKSMSDLFIWDVNKQTVKNISLPDPIRNAVETDPESGGYIYRDNKGHMWVSYHGLGLAKFDAHARLLKFLMKQDGTLPAGNIRVIQQLPDGKILAGMEKGLFILNPDTYQVDDLSADPLLKELDQKRIVDLYLDGAKLWIATSPSGAAYCYDLSNKTLKRYSTANGLSSDRVYCITKGVDNNMYIGTFDGLNVIDTTGRIKIINKQNGLRHPRVENLVTDNQGKLWITNFTSLISYDPVSRTFNYFDERNGVSNSGFGLGTGILLQDGRILFGNKGLLIIKPENVKQYRDAHPTVSIHRLYDDNAYELLKPKEVLKLDYANSKLTLYYVSSPLITANRVFYRYKMKGLDTSWQQPTKNNQVTYNLKPGQYTFYIQSGYNDGIWTNNDIEIRVLVASAWWQTWWFRGLVLLIVAMLLFFAYKQRVRVIGNKAAMNQQLAELEAKAIRAQMNPHFIFNSLNAIQECIVTEEVDNAYDYLSRFSKLLRMVLDNSEKNFISLSDELETIRLYLSLESLRFSQSFSYAIELKHDVDKDDIFIPSLLLQPFVENAIWHGLVNKEGEKKLLLQFEEKQGFLECVIYDNGIGRKRSAEIKKNKLGAANFESKGTRLVQQRIGILNRERPGSASIETIDLYDETGNAAGTRIVIKLATDLNRFKTRKDD